MYSGETNGRHELNKKQISHLFDMLLCSANQLGFGSVSFGEGNSPRNSLQKHGMFFGGVTTPLVGLTVTPTDNDYAAIDPVAQVVPFSSVTVDWGEVAGLHRFLPKLPDLV